MSYISIKANLLINVDKTKQVINSGYKLTKMTKPIDRSYRHLVVMVV